MFTHLEALTSIQPYSGWRNSATEGEREALDYVESWLRTLPYLSGLDLSLKRQEFRVFLTTELWETRLHLTIGGLEIQVPVNGLRGPRDEIGQALRFDSDGQLNDSDRDPVVVTGEIVAVNSIEGIRALSPQDVEGRIVFLDYAVVDQVVQGGINRAVGIAQDLLEEKPAGLVLVTSYSNELGSSHGSFVGDNSALNWVQTQPAVPVLYARLEDMAEAGIDSWQALTRIQGARLTWDADVFSPGTSGNLIAHIPGADSSRALILGAHIDSPNSPGALDDGSGSVILMELARVLDAAQIQPPLDLYLVWFGSEELGLYGSAHFAQTHQELLDRAVAMLQIDMLSYPLADIQADLSLITWSYGRLGDGRMLWPEHLGKTAAIHGISSVSEDAYYLYSDNSSFGGFDVPHADLVYVNEPEMEATSSLHYACHIHDPYDTVDLVEAVSDVWLDMARVVLAAALDPTLGEAELRVTPKADRRALIVASHTEPVHLTPSSLTEFGMALSMEGLDVDLVPYGQPVTAEELSNADLVVALPVMDYPSPEGDPDLYDEAWTEAEVAALQAYVKEGGLLVLTNSAYRLKYGNTILDPNEDWEDVNALASRFGVTYSGQVMEGVQIESTADHPLLDGVQFLELAQGNALSFTLADGETLAQKGGQPAVALVPHGKGQVLVLAEVGILGAAWGPPANLPFWRNLARYVQ